MRLILPMGGRGTRLRPFSHTTPKPLLPLVGRPAIARLLDAFAGALGRAVEEVVFVLGPTADANLRRRLTEACAAEGLGASFALQPEPLGTAHAIACAGDALDGEVLTCWGDTLFTPSADVPLDGFDLLAWTVEVEDPRRFGVVVRDDGGRITGLIEKPPDATHRETLIGAYYVRDGRDLRAVVDEMIATGATGAGGEFQLTDAYDRLVQRGARMATAPAAQWLDTGTLASYRETVRALLETGEHAPTAAEVAVAAPSFVHPDATVRRSVVGPHAVVEAGAVVEDSVLRATVVMAGATVRDAELTDSLVGERATVEGLTGTFTLGDDAIAHG